MYVHVRNRSVEYGLQPRNSGLVSIQEFAFKRGNEERGGLEIMQIAGRRVLVCNCEKTMKIDAKALAKACGGDDLHVHCHLCRTELSNFTDAVKQGELGAA